MSYYYARVAALILALGLANLAQAVAKPDFETAPQSSPGMEVVVVEAVDCVYCYVFRRDVVPSYQASPRGKEIPLRFVDINDTEAAQLKLAGPVQVVPTFIVVKDAQEVGRIPGYTGPESFFHTINYLLSASPY